MRILINIVAFVCYSQLGLACERGTNLIDLPIKEMGWTQTETAGISSISDVIFSGILIGFRMVEESNQDLLFFERKKAWLELTFKMLKSYKGEKRDTVKIRTNNSSEACGFYAPQIQNV